MGAAESRLAFRNNVLKLSSTDANAGVLSDQDFWKSFLDLPTSTEEVFTLCGVKDVKKIRDSSPEHFEYWIRYTTTEFLNLSRYTQPLSTEETKRALNCARILARLLPYLFDKDAATDSNLEDRLFWPLDEPLERTSGFQLIEAVLNMLFWQGLTLPVISDRETRPDQSHTVYFSIWNIGIGASAAPPASKEHISARTELLQLLLVLLARVIYVKPADLLTNNKDRWTQSLEKLEKRKVLTMLCSLLNTALSWDPVGYALLPYNHVFFGDSMAVLSVLALQVLDALLDYGYAPAPGSASNVFRHYLAKLHRKEDFDFILTNLARLLKNPLQAEHALLPNSTQRIPCHSELLCFLWKLIECNVSFVKHLASSPKVLEIVSSIVYFLLCSRCDSSQLGLFRLCCFLLHQLSVEREFCVQLNSDFDFGKQQFPQRAPSGFTATSIGQQGLGFPSGWRSGTFADFLILAINAAVTAVIPKQPAGSLPQNSSTNQGGTLEQEGPPAQGDSLMVSSYSALHETLLIVFSNISPYLQNLSIATCQKLLHLYKSVSSPVFLFSREENHRLVFYLLEGMNFIIAYQNHANLNLLYAIVRNAPSFAALKQLTFRQCEKAYNEFLERKRQLPANRPPLTEDWYNFWHSRLPLATTLYFLLIIAPKLAAHLHKLAGEADYSPQQAITMMSSLSLEKQEAGEGETSQGKSSVDVVLPANATDSRSAASVQSAQHDGSVATDGENEDAEFSAEDLKLLGEIQFPVYTEESAIISFLKSQNYVGLLPHPPPVYVRNFVGADDGIHVWFSSFLWGILFLNNSLDQSQGSVTTLSSPTAPSGSSVPPLFSSTQINLFKIKFKNME